MTTVDAVKARWKAVVVALVAIGAAFGVGFPEGTVDQSTELVGMVAAGVLGLYALGRVVWDKVQARIQK